MIANINPETGTAYGYISAFSLDQELVGELMTNGDNLTANEAFAEWMANEIQEMLDDNDSLTHELAEEQAKGNEYNFWDTYEDCEPTISGTKDGVNYCTSWLGGALNFFIFFSPYITEKARLASLCVPNAGIIDVLDGGEVSYDVPPDWRRTND
jgi:hypothetical protein